jgi:hypothetical protein
MNTTPNSGITHGRVWLLALALCALAGCASQSATTQTDQARRAQEIRVADSHRYHVLDDWYWRSRLFDPYRNAYFAGYGVWGDPWLYWDLRYGAHGRSLWDPFDRFSWDPHFRSRFYFSRPYSGFWGAYWGSPWFDQRFLYGRNTGYRPYQHNDRGLEQAPNSTASADRALELLRQTERRRSIDPGTRPSQPSFFPRDMGSMQRSRSTSDWPSSSQEPNFRHESRRESSVESKRDIE